MANIAPELIQVVGKVRRSQEKFIVVSLMKFRNTSYIEIKNCFTNSFGKDITQGCNTVGKRALPELIEILQQANDIMASGGKEPF